MEPNGLPKEGEEALSKKDLNSLLDERRRHVLQIERLEAMPHVVWQLLEALGSSHTTAAKLESIIEHDVALASKLLSLANSAYYGFQQRITTIRHAVVLIGYRELQFLALGSGLAGVFDFRKTPRGFNAEALWVHCMAVAWAASFIAEATRQVAPGEAMIAGLLHDVGKLVLATCLKEDLAALLDLEEGGMPYYLAEEELGLEHTRIGYWLAKRWSLPEVHTMVIQGHHRPQVKNPYVKAVCIVALADRLVKALRLGMIHDSRPWNVSMALKALNLSERTFREIATHVGRMLPSMQHLWLQLLGKGENLRDRSGRG
ncbi:MAG: HDOD domain-containing protein [Deltaproteobacteria bacterium]|nr:HDOD domain-containing protein [Deltaproteobacteria bacterium]